jgi:hypothetical protein
MRVPILLFTAALTAAVTSGCTGQITAEPTYAPAPPPPPAPIGEAPAPPPPAPPRPPAPVVEDDDVVYDAPPPVANIETYPSVVYGGTTVFYVGGIWYRRAPNGWARYRTEPPGLARARAAHARDPRWAREGTPRPAPPGAAQMQRQPAPPAREVR